MQIVIRPASDAEGTSVYLETNSYATISTLISEYCSKTGISYNHRLRLFRGSEELPSHKTLIALNIKNDENLAIQYTQSSILIDYRFLAAVILLGFGIIIVVILSTIYGTTGNKYPNEFAVVMDAGSSKTNTLLYTWQSAKNNGTGCVKQVSNCYAKGGIAKMDPTKLDLVIDCAKNITKDINAESIPKTPLYFAATAGMRLLNLTDPERLKQILENVDIQLKETGLDLKIVEIIPGEDEGSYGWIAANFLKETLEIPLKQDPWIPTTYGALDMGGASMQISFAVPDSEQPSVTAMDLYGQTHYVFSHSNLCFGRDEAERRYRYFLISKNFNSSMVQDPCAPSGFNYTIKGSDMFNQPCILNDELTRTLKKNPSLKEAVYNVQGSSMPDECKKNVSQLLDFDLCSKKLTFKECFMKLQNIPEKQKYLAFASYFYTTNFLNVTKSNLTEYEAATFKFCSKDYDEVLEISNSTHVTEYCFNAQYIHEVLTNGFKFTSSTWKDLNFVEKIADKDVGWTLGYMINATNLIPAKMDTPKMISTVLFVVLIIIFVLVIIAILIYIGYYYKKYAN